MFDGKAEDEFTADARGGFQCDPSMVVGDAAIGHGEPHAGAFADFLRREEWLENFLLSFFIFPSPLHFT